MAVARRDFIRGMSTVLLVPAIANAAGQQEGLPDALLQDVLRRLFGEKRMQPGPRIDMRIVDLAEDGSVVPIQIRTDYSDVRSIAILADRNPVALVAHFTLGPHAEPFISTRIKLAESTWVRAVAATAMHLYENHKFVRVVQGGCD
jgi:sulfur-oxidizing protein SoxY